MKVAVVGTGYVGLVSGVSLASKGHDVTCVDINARIVERLNKGDPHIYEVGLPGLLIEAIEAKRFRASTDLTSALQGAELVIVAVGTPSENGAIDLTYVRDASRQIGEFIRTSEDFLSVIVKSTVVPGTTDTVVRGEIEKASGKTLGEFGLGMNPEFLREGEAIADFMYPDRIVFGYEDPKTLEALERLYAPWDVDKVCVNTRTAELIKYANNALLATQISAVNEIANLAAAVGGIDALEVVKGVQLDKRWNPIMASGRANPHILTYLVPGCGFGGSCFPKDVQALRTLGEQNGLRMQILNAILDVNDAQPRQVCDIIERDTPLAGRNVLLLGLAFKPGTDDVRESASLKIASDLLARGAVVTAHDPIAVDHFQRALGDAAAKIAFVDDWKGEATRADVIIIATKWPEYSELTDRDAAGKVLFDARRMLDPKRFGSANYLSIGRRIA